ncbi:MAG TPA: divergent polysaccharide deacetylase family protein [Thermodesulfobacteriota bacterium]|nr:divergent polysaccharide deacetylase family protein [Thermodesulfobacteriota bacterium]
MAKKPNRRGRLKKWMGYVFSFFLGALLGFGGYLYLTREKALSPEDFSQKVFLVDQIIQSQFYEFGIQKKNILLHQMSSKKEGDLVWKQSSLKVQILPSLPFSLVEKNLRRSLSALGRPVSIQSSQKSESLRLEVKVLDRITHQLTFVSSIPSALKMGLHPKIAIVIDDLGGENKISQELLRWDLPITFSILPFAPFSQTLAREAHRKGREVILHLPMEPHGYPQVRPGEGVLLEEMDEASFLRQLSKDIEAVPYIKGVSNHMGSRLMEDPEKMKIVFSELKRRGLFFLDSRTTPQTIGLQVAQSVGLKAMERNIFIDNSLAEEDIKRQLEQLIQFSISKGKAIGIGHPHSSTVKFLKEIIPKMKERGIEVVPLSAVME